MIEIGICDGDRREAEGTKKIILNYGEARGCLPLLKISLFESGAKFLESMNENNRYDILFFDVTMPEVSGIDAAKKIRKKGLETEIVFLTDSPEFAFEAYSLDVLSYLLKPIDHARIYHIMDKVLVKKEKGEQKSFVITEKHSYKRVFFKELLYIEVINKRLIYYMVDGETLTAVSSMRQAEEMLLLHSQFAKPHRSYLVNLDYVESFTPCSLRMTNQHSIGISRKYYTPFKGRYLAYYAGIDR